MVDVPRRSYYFSGFVVAFFLYAAIVKVGALLGINLDLAVTLILCVALTLVFPEPTGGLGWGWRGSGWVLVCASFLCIAWTFLIWLWSDKESEIKIGWGFIVGAANFLVATPWFEEKMVRHLLLDALIPIVGVLISVASVSIFFAIAHGDMYLWAMLASLVLCWMRLRLRARTSHCVAVHGLVNAYVLMLYFI